jgi:hypothetical protein
MEKRTGISTGFTIVMGVLILGISGLVYMHELKGFAQAVTIPARVVKIKIIPRLCLLKLETEDERFAGQLLAASVPSWDSRNIGDRIVLKVDPEDPSLVWVDEFLYLHKTSLGILAGSLFLCLILIGVTVFKGKH